MAARWPVGGPPLGRETKNRANFRITGRALWACKPAKLRRWSAPESNSNAARITGVVKHGPTGEAPYDLTKLVGADINRCTLGPRRTKRPSTSSVRCSTTGACIGWSVDR
jgi:hypothetical protein